MILHPIIHTRGKIHTLKLVVLLLSQVYCFSAFATPISFDVSWSDQTGAHDLSDYRGSPVILHFWASWCGSCRNEMPQISDVIKEGLGQVNFFALSVDNRLSLAHKAMRGLDSSMIIPIGIVDRDVVGKFNFRSIPSTVIIDGEGSVVGRYNGPAPWYNHSFIAALRALN